MFDSSSSIRKTSREASGTFGTLLLTWRTIDPKYKYFPQKHANTDEMPSGQCYPGQIKVSQINYLVSYLYGMVKPISDYSYLHSSNVILQPLRFLSGLCQIVRY